MIKVIRRTIQLLTLVIVILTPFLSSKGLNFLLGNLFSISFFGFSVIDPTLLIQHILLNHHINIDLLIASAIPFLIAIIFGKVFCSFACPVNLILEMIKKVNVFVKRVTVKGSSKIRYGILVFLILAIFLTGIPIFNFLSLPGIISVEIQKVFYLKLFSIFWGFFLLLLFLELVIRRRFWCNYICPQGSIIGLIRTPKTLKIIKKQDDLSKCSGCKKCIMACPFYLNPLEGNIYPQCTNCFECVITCKKTHKNNPQLTWKF